MRLLNIARLATKKKIRKLDHTLSRCRHISYRVIISYPTSFQVSFFDENGMPNIREYAGPRFEKEIQVRDDFRKIRIKVFVWNPFQLKDQTLHIMIQVVGKVTREKIFPISHLQRFDGWFYLDHNQL